SAVIDWSDLGVGDPACDLMCAWALFSGESRAAFRAALGARLYPRQSAYYLHTNPVGVTRPSV
ncbi:MAG: phosphotransferase, partial [Oscillochloris sp.]|nr:phosphotransferase [Oscillochloris sp.]